MKKSLSALLCVLALTACSETLTSPDSPARADVSARGLTEITITGLTSGQPIATARAVPGAGSMAPSGRDPSVLSTSACVTCVPRLTTPVGTGTDGTIQLKPVSVATFTVGDRPDGYRYVSATYRVRNATVGGVQYNTDRHNLTFVAVNTPATLDGTAISRINRFDGASAAIAPRDVMPSGAARIDTENGILVSATPDVLQAYYPSEVSSLDALPGITSALPYGFVVSNPDETLNRTLGANPGASYAGMVTFAFKVPLAATAADDAFAISAWFVAVDDATLNVTQSFEETSLSSRTALITRATNIGAVLGLRSVVGATISSNPAERICELRTAGTAASPEAFMLNLGWMSFTPTPFNEGAFLAGPSQDFTGTFCEPVDLVDATTFAVHGMQTGRVLGTYSSPGDQAISPAGDFHAGEQVQVTLTSGLAMSGRPLPNPAVFQYRVAAGGSGDFSAIPLAWSFSGDHDPQAVAPGDFDGDGKLDFVAVSLGGGSGVAASVQVQAGNLTSFAQSQEFTYDRATVHPRSVTVGDMNDDGLPDIVAAVTTGAFPGPYFSEIWVYLNQSATPGTFDPAVTVGISGDYAYPGLFLDFDGDPVPLVLGDFNTDGHLDVVTGVYEGVVVALGTGTGTLGLTTTVPVTGSTLSLSVGDVNQDDHLDIAAGMSATANVALLLGDGDGGFANAPGSPMFLAAVTDHPRVTLGEFNGDALLDLALASTEDDEVGIMLGDGTGAFGGSLPSLSAPDVAHLLAADFTGDGIDDLAWVAYGSMTGDKELSIQVNDGDAGFSPSSGSPFDPFGRVNHLATGDFNNDGTVDVIYSLRDNNQLIVRYNQ